MSGGQSDPMQNVKNKDVEGGNQAIKQAMGYVILVLKTWHISDFIQMEI